jgi:hypothetical protein
MWRDAPSFATDLIFPNPWRARVVQGNCFFWELEGGDLNALKMINAHNPFFGLKCKFSHDSTCVRPSTPPLSSPPRYSRVCTLRCPFMVMTELAAMTRASLARAATCSDASGSRLYHSTAPYRVAKTRERKNSHASYQQHHHQRQNKQEKFTRNTRTWGWGCCSFPNDSQKTCDDVL